MTQHTPTHTPVVDMRPTADGPYKEGWDCFNRGGSRDDLPYITEGGKFSAWFCWVNGFEQAAIAKARGEVQS